LLRENTNHPSSEGTFLIPTPTKTKSVRGFRLSRKPRRVGALGLL
jgi:hypothetical protein